MPTQMDDGSNLNNGIVPGQQNTNTWHTLTTKYSTDGVKVSTICSTFQNRHFIFIKTLQETFDKSGIFSSCKIIASD